MLFNPLCIMLTATGLYMLIKLRFFFLVNPIKTITKTIGGMREKESFRSFMLALAGTLGIGNIFGVSLGIIVGGAGSVFWMLVSSVFASVIKYSEIVITHDCSRTSDCRKGGSIFYSIPLVFEKFGNPLAGIYALACLLLSFSMGAGLQIGAVSEASHDFCGVPPIIIGVLFGLVILISVVGGVRKIEKITALTIPITTVIYILIAVSVIVVNHDRIDDAVRLIISDAFRVDSAGGGMLGFLFSRGVIEGYSRGILSNEAGTGTSSMAHSRSGISDSSLLGLRGIVEVLFDTVILCMLTAFAILTSGVNIADFEDGMPLVLGALSSSLGPWASVGVLISVVFFAYATVVCWFYYGSRCASFLFGKFGERLFLPVFISFCVMSPLFENRFLVAATDVFILIMTAITLSVILKRSDRIVALSDESGVLPAKMLSIKGTLSRRSEKSRDG